MKSFFVLLILSIFVVALSFCIGAFYGYFYPMKYQEEIVNFSSLYRVDAGYIASVANVESGFDERAKSNKGAIGIMQLMPSTAEWLASKLGEEFDENMLYDGKYNIKLGTFYLSYLFLQFDDVKTALCAYNAGQGNVKNWLNNKEYSADGKTLIKIPFEETKNYITKVLKNYIYYKNQYKK